MGTCATETLEQYLMLDARSQKSQSLPSPILVCELNKTVLLLIFNRPYLRWRYWYSVASFVVVVVVVVVCYVMYCG